MTVITVPADSVLRNDTLAGMPPGDGPARAPLARHRDPPVPRLQRLGDRGPSRVEPRGRRAHHRPAPCLLVPRRRHRLGHRSPGLRAQARHRPAGRFRRPAPGRRHVRLPEPRRVGTRPGREQPRLDGAVVRLRDGCRPQVEPGPAPRGRGPRRRRPDRRRRLRGAEQHRGLGGERHHRPQRQRALLRADRVEDLVRGRSATRAVARAQKQGRRRRATSSRPSASATSALWTATTSTRSSRRCSAPPAGRDQSCCTCTRPRVAAIGPPSSTRRSAFTTSAPSIRTPASRSRRAAGG